MTDVTKSDFDLLLEDITKAFPGKGTEKGADKGDKKVAAAVAEGEEASEAEEGAEAAPVVKSFTIKLADGTESEAIDGTEILKALNDRVEANETKILAGFRALMDVAKSLSEQVTALSSRGVGRATVLTIAEKPAAKAEEIAKASVDGVTPQAFFAKAMVMQGKGEITGFEIARAETALNRGEPIPQEIVLKVLGK